MRDGGAESVEQRVVAHEKTACLRFRGFRGGGEREPREDQEAARARAPEVIKVSSPSLSKGINLLLVLAHYEL